MPARARRAFGGRLALCLLPLSLGACDSTPATPAASPTAQPSGKPNAGHVLTASASSAASGFKSASTFNKPDPDAAPDGDDLTAQVYGLAGISKLEVGHRFLNPPKLAMRPSSACGDQGCGIRWSFPLNHPELLADHTTRLTLIWSADKKGLSELEASLAIVGENTHLRQTDWLRPSAESAAGRRITLDVPARYVRRHGGIGVEVRIAARAQGADAKAVPYFDGLEVEVLP